MSVPPLFPCARGSSGGAPSSFSAISSVRSASNQAACEQTNQVSAAHSFVSDVKSLDEVLTNRNKKRGGCEGGEYDIIGKKKEQKKVNKKRKKMGNDKHKSNKKHHKKKKIKYTDRDDTSYSETSEENSNEDDKSKIYLPNGHFIYEKECQSLERKLPEMCFISREGDGGIFQFGSPYRLDIPSYDIYIPSGQYKTQTPFMSSENLILQNYNTPSGIKSFSNKLKSNSKEDPFHVPHVQRYFGGGQRHVTPSTSIYRVWMKGKSVKFQALNDVISLPSHLPDYTEFNSDSDQVSMDKAQIRYDINTQSLVFNDDKMQVGPFLKTDEKILQSNISSLSACCRDIDEELSACSALVLSPFQALARARQWTRLSAMQGKLASLQILVTVDIIEPRNLCNFIQSLISNSVERELLVFRDAIQRDRSIQGVIPYLYLAIAHKVDMMRKVCPLNHSLFQEKNSILEFDALWKNINRDCPLISDFRRMKSRYEIAAFFNRKRRAGDHIRDEEQLTSYYRQILSREHFMNSAVIALKNRIAADRLINCSAASSRDSSSSAPAQDEIDQFGVEAFVDLCQFEADGGHHERQVAYIQAMLELNFSVLPYIFVAADGFGGTEASRLAQISPLSSHLNSKYGQFQTAEKIETIAMSEFEILWDSEYVRFGEKSNIRPNEKKQASLYLEWFGVGCPLEGWDVSGGVTGHMDMSSNGPSEAFIDEPSPSEYLLRTENILMLSNSTERNVESSNSNYAMCGLDGKSPLAANMNIEHTKDEKDATERAPRLCHSKDKSNESAISPSVERDEDNEDFEMVYSAVHGYKIRVPKERKNLDNSSESLETIAYKKVLGDIRDEELKDLTAEEVLKHYAVVSEKENNTSVPIEPLKDSDSIQQKRRDEKVFHMLQWRPLRVNASTDSDAALLQPDRVILKEDLNPHLFTIRSRSGRELLIFRCLERLGVLPQAICGGLRPSSSSGIPKRPTENMSSFWTSVFHSLSTGITTGDSDVHCVLKETVGAVLGVNALDAKDRPGGFFATSDPLHAINSSLGEVSGCSFDAIKVSDAVGMVLEPSLIDRHISCSLLGLASPLENVIETLKRLIDLHSSLKNLTSGINLRSIPALLNFIEEKESCILLFSDAFCCNLRSCLIKVLMARHTLDGSMKIWNERNRENSRAPSMSEIFHQFQVECQSLLQEDSSTTPRQSSLSLDVWNAFIRSSICFGKISIANKVCIRSLEALEKFSFHGKEQSSPQLEISESSLRDELSSLSSGQKGSSCLLKIESDVERWQKSAGICRDVSGSVELYWLALQLVMSRACPQFAQAMSGNFEPISEYLPSEQSQSVTNASMLLLVQLAQGGSLDSPELAKDLSSFLKAKKKKLIMISQPKLEKYLDQNIRPTTCKFHALLTFLFSNVENMVKEERSRSMSHHTRLHHMSAAPYSSEFCKYIQSTVRLVVLQAWWEFFCEQKLCGKSSGFRESHPSLAVFNKWINMFLKLLYGDDSDSSIGDSNVDNDKKQQSYLFSSLTGSWSKPKRQSVFEVCQCRVDCGGGIWMSDAEQCLVSCLEELYLYRIHFCIVVLCCWNASPSCSSGKMMQKGDLLRQYTLLGLYDFPLNGALNHVLLTITHFHDLHRVFPILRASQSHSPSLLPLACAPSSRASLRAYIDEIIPMLSLYGHQAYAHALMICPIMLRAFTNIDVEGWPSDSVLFDVRMWRQDDASALLSCLDYLLLPQLPGDSKQWQHLTLSSCLSSGFLDRHGKNWLSARSDFVPFSCDWDDKSHILCNKPSSLHYELFWKVYIRSINLELQESESRHSPGIRPLGCPFKSRGAQFEFSLRKRLLLLFSCSHGGQPLLTLSGQDVSAVSGCLSRKSLWFQEMGLLDLVYSQVQLMHRSKRANKETSGASTCNVDDIAAELLESMQSAVNELGILLRTE